MCNGFALAGILLGIALIFYCPMIIMHELLHAYGHAKYGEFEGEVIVFNKKIGDYKFTSENSSYCYNRLEPCYLNTQMIKILLYPLIIQVPLFLTYAAISLLAESPLEAGVILAIGAVFFFSGCIPDLLLALKCCKMDGSVREVIIDRNFRIEQCNN